MPIPAPHILAEERAELDRIDRAIVDLLRARQDAAARLHQLRTEARIGPRSLAEENETLGRYSNALGRTGTRIAMLLLLA